METKQNNKKTNEASSFINEELQKFKNKSSTDGRIKKELKDQCDKLLEENDCLSKNLSYLKEQNKDLKTSLEIATAEINVQSDNINKLKEYIALLERKQKLMLNDLFIVFKSRDEKKVLTFELLDDYYNDEANHE